MFSFGVKTVGLSPAHSPIETSFKICFDHNIPEPCFSLLVSLPQWGRVRLISAVSWFFSLQGLWFLWFVLLKKGFDCPHQRSSPIKTLTCNFISFVHDLSCRTCPVHALFRFRFALQLNICSCPPGVVWRGTLTSRDTTLHDLLHHFATYRASLLAIYYSSSKSASLFSTWLHSVTS